MDVDAAAFGRRQQSLAEDLAVGGHDERVRLEAGHTLHELRRPALGRRLHGEPESFGGRLDR
jgi:hypothetical protein